MEYKNNNIIDIASVFENCYDEDCLNDDDAGFLNELFNEIQATNTSPPPPVFLFYSSTNKFYTTGKLKKNLGYWG